MEIAFWVSILIILYTYFGYPILVYLFSFFVRTKREKSDFYKPYVSIIISAYNEEHNVENKIKTLLGLDYPAEKIEILIGSDGSTDKTKAILSSRANERIKVFFKKEREGKPSMLNMLAAKAKGEILVFTDARQRLDKNSLKELVKNFSDDKVGSVSAELFFESDDDKTDKGIGLYWKYEKFIRSHESKIGSMLGATGAMYAIRKSLFSELPKDLILDDVYIPLKAVGKGYRAIFEPKAHIFDLIVKNSKEEFLRKTRTLAGNFQIFVYLKELFNPFKSPIAFQLFSHKFLRLIVPFLLVIVFISNIFILKDYFYWMALVFQTTFYALALLSSILKLQKGIFDIPHMFCVMNLAAIVGLWKFLTNKQEVLWQKAEVVAVKKER